ncbi:MAG: PAS domain S-box protein [Hyphomicrobiaceae bacterium]|nr:PAS domain S-box protein [Hyphomicrobiaceae bacterium]
MTDKQDEPFAANATLDALTLRALLESAAAGIVSIDARGAVRSANPAVARLFGFDPSELIGRNVSILMAGRDRTAHDNYMHRYLTTGASGIMGVGREVLGRRKDGTEFPLHLTIGEFEVAGRRFFTGVMIDLSKQRAAEFGLEHQQALFRAVFDSLPDPVIISDLDHKIRDVNPAFTRVFGWSAQDLIGATSHRLYARPEDCDLSNKSEPPALPHRSPGPGSSAAPRVLDLKRENGEIFPGAVVKTSIVTQKGRCLGFLEIIRDISLERRRAAQLMQAQRMEAIGQLTGGIAHDFNNILTVVLGNVELLEMRLDGSEKTLGLAREAREAAEIGARLTDRLLTFGRRQLLETRDINLNEFVLGLTELLRRTLGEDIDLSTALEADLALTEADPGQVENAVLNLAINARDAMPKGGLLVIETRNVMLDETAVAATPELSAGQYVVLSVSDTGHGMTAEVKARAFEPFFTTKGGATGRGSGLGLATIYGFVKQSGGHATITSEAGRGTTVELFLPALAARVQEAVAPLAQQDVPRGDGHRVLVVEDNDKVRRLACRRIEELGYVVESAENGIAALERLARSADFDLVFTDVVMPGGLSGLDVAREVEALFPGIAVVLTTGYSDEMLQRAGEGESQPLLIRKPYNQTQLARALADALAEQRASSRAGNEVRNR